jgi:translation initiation factor 1A
MPKKKKAGKNTKSKNVFEVKRNLIEPDLNCQVYGILSKTLGSRFFDVNCLDGKQRRCKVRSKRLRVKQDDVVIVSLREFDDKNADIIYKYNSEEVRELQRIGSLPNKESLGIKLDENYIEDDCAFDFEDI